MGLRPLAIARRATAAVLAILAAGGSTAAASPMEDPASGGAVFSGPTLPHASSIFINPAALGLAGRGFHLHIGGSFRLDTVGIDRELVEPDGSRAAGPSLDSSTWTPSGTIAVYRSVLE
ncbi:MAG TPA: hypothetical protein VKZ63_06520, partial [Kofleriaceae bacterium]|nr:hypothetical protein [Kofleriaceae bacterium]